MKEITLLILFVVVYGTVLSQVPVLELISEDSNNFREKILDVRIDGIDKSYIQLRNNTSINGSFEPCLAGSSNFSNRSGLQIMGNVQSENDINDIPIITMTSFVDNGLGWENGGYAYAVNRHYLRIRGFDSNDGNRYLLEIDEEGDVGIGTNNPKSKLEVTDGDVFITDVNSGVIMKSNNNKCWRMTISNMGESQIKEISCPN